MNNLKPSRKLLLLGVSLVLLAIISIVAFIAVAALLPVAHRTVGMESQPERHGELISSTGQPETLYLLTWVNHEPYPPTSKVRVLDRRTREFVKIIDSDSGPDVAISREGDHFYLAAMKFINGGASSKDYLTAFDTTSWQALWNTELESPPNSNGRFGTRDGTGPSALTLSPDGSRLFIEKQAGWDSWFTVL